MKNIYAIIIINVSRKSHNYANYIIFLLIEIYLKDKICFQNIVIIIMKQIENVFFFFPSYWQIGKLDNTQDLVFKKFVIFFNVR